MLYVSGYIGSIETRREQMTSHEISDQFNATIAKADNALRNGWISQVQHKEKIAKAYSWRRKAEYGHWDYQAYRHGA